MRTVLLTGATGFIGKNAIEPLIKMGYEVFALSSGENKTEDKRIHWLKANLFNRANVEKVFKEVKPQYLLHFAWDTRPGIYLEDNSNFELLKTSLDMLKYFKENGGRRAVFAGTCFEYDLGSEVLYESTPRNPQTTYGKCKNYLNGLASLYCQNNEISFGWGRIFYVYGQNENVKRLTGYVIDSFKNDEEVIIKTSQLVKDYMYTKEIARAFVEFLNSNVEGDVNICTGEGISLGNYCKKIAKKMNKEHLLILKEESTKEPLQIVGSSKRLHEEVGFVPAYSIDEGLNEILKHAWSLD